MSAADVPLPPELALDEEPFDDETLDNALESLASRMAEVPEFRERIESADNIAPVVRWRIESDEDAEWAMRKLALRERRLAEEERKAEDWRSRILAWFERATRRSRRSAEFFRGHLERYALERRQETGEATLWLPSGAVSTRASTKRKVRVGDDEAFRRWALEHLGSPLVRVAPELVAAEADRRLQPVEVDDGQDLVLTLACEHVLVIDDPEVMADLIGRIEVGGPAAAGSFTCSCPQPQGVVRSLVRAHRKWIVVDPEDGEPVPWATVVLPGDPDATVRPS